MKFRPLSAFLLLAALVAPLRAQGPYLHGFDPVSLLPPPPALHDPEDVADRDSTFRIYSQRTPEEVALGKAEHHVTLAAFAPVLGSDYQPAKCPKLAALFQDLDAEA